jgi:hypothetical protein
MPHPRAHNSIREAAVCAVVLGALITLESCGSGASDPVVVRVAGVSISRATVDHWTTAIAGGRVTRDPSRRQSLREQALNFLISSDWAIGEALARGLKPTKREIEQQLQQKRSASFPGGEDEFREFLKQSGRTLQDATLEAKAEWAASQLRRLAARGEPEISAQVAAYYSSHKERYLIPEQREVEITNRKHPAEVVKLKREVESEKKSFSRFSQRGIAERPRRLIPKLDRALFSAKPDVLTGPIKQRVDYYLFKVTRIVPAKRRPLAQVEEQIRKQLAARQRRETMAGFIKAWRSRWIARTRCSPGYVVQKCRQYSGDKAPEDATTFT